MSDPLVTVTVTAYAADEDARGAKGALDTAGIAAVVDASVPRRVKVRVENVQAIRAGDVLNAQAPPSSEIFEPDEEEGERLCPSCDSREIGPSRRAQTFALTATIAAAVGIGAGVVQGAFFVIIAAAVFLLIRGRWRCNLCGATFD